MPRKRGPVLNGKIDTRRVEYQAGRWINTVHRTVKCKAILSPKSALVSSVSCTIYNTNHGIHCRKVRRSMCGPCSHMGQDKSQLQYP